MIGSTVRYYQIILYELAHVILQIIWGYPNLQMILSHKDGKWLVQSLLLCQKEIFQEMMWICQKDIDVT